MNYRIYQLKFQNSLLAAALEGLVEVEGGWAGLVQGWHQWHPHPSRALSPPSHFVQPSAAQPQPAASHTLFFYQYPCPQCPQSGLASGHWRSCRIFLGFQGHVLFWGESMAENKRAIAMSTHISLSDLLIPRRSACGWGHIHKTWYDERGKQTKYWYLLQYNLFKACKNIGGKICIS